MHIYRPYTCDYLPSLWRDRTGVGAVHTTSQFSPEVAAHEGGSLDVNTETKVRVPGKRESKVTGGKRQRLSNKGVDRSKDEDERQVSLGPRKHQRLGNKGGSAIGGIDTAELFARVLREAGQEGGGGGDYDDDPEWQPEEEDLDAEGEDAGGGIGRLSKEQAEQVGRIGGISISWALGCLEFLLLSFLLIFLN